MNPSKQIDARAAAPAKLETSTTKSSMAGTVHSFIRRKPPVPFTKKQIALARINYKYVDLTSPSKDVPPGTKALPEHTTSSLQMPSAPPPTPYLRKLPYELKGLIFPYCLDIKDTETPKLLVALRCDKELYPQALELYYKLNYFYLNSETLPRLHLMSPKAVANIRKIYVDAELSPIIPVELLQGTSITTLFVHRTYDGLRYQNASWVKMALQFLPQISRVIYDGVDSYSWIGRERRRRAKGHPARSSSATIRMLDKHLGMECQDIDEYVDGFTLEGIFWEAEKGKALAWIDFWDD